MEPLGKRAQLGKAGTKRDLQGMWWGQPVTLTEPHAQKELARILESSHHLPRAASPGSWLPTPTPATQCQAHTYTCTYAHAGPHCTLPSAPPPPLLQLQLIEQ